MSLTRKDLDPGGYQMNMNYQYALVSKKANGILDCIKQSMVSRLTGVILPLSTNKARPGELCPVLSS